MKWTWALVPLLLVALAVHADDSSSEEDEYGRPLAGPCNVETCVLPNCRCSSSNIPGGLSARNTPQFVMLTFDDGVNVQNIETYRKLLDDRRNHNACRVGATFYVSHQYTNYVLVNELYNKGYEVALHSITHQTPQTYWANATRETIEREFADQRVQISHFANIPLTAVQGIRMPFLQLAGNSSFEVMKDIEMLYDSSWPSVSFIDPGLWPYTLHHASTQDCPVPPCPSAELPGPWVMPLITWRDLQGFPCAMADACFAPPDVTNENAWFEFISQNFERHYFSNRSPFGLYFHEWYLSAHPAVFRALERFLDVINNLPDTFLVNAREVIEWVKDPTPVNEYRNKPCRWHQPTTCPPTSCGNLVAQHTMELFWMQICNVCPRVYPWRGNPLGI